MLLCKWMAKKVVVTWMLASMSWIVYTNFSINMSTQSTYALKHIFHISHWLTTHTTKKHKPMCIFAFFLHILHNIYINFPILASAEDNRNSQLDVTFLFFMLILRNIYLDRRTMCSRKCRTTAGRVFNFDIYFSARWWWKHFFIYAPLFWTKRRNKKIIHYLV